MTFGDGGYFVAWAVVGALFAAFSVWSVGRVADAFAHRWPRYEQRSWAVYLLVAALIYVGFAATGGADRDWLLTELIGVALYGAVAAAGALRWPRLVGLGWLAHVAWDLAVHPGGHPGYVPAWYPPACLGFDLVAGVWLLQRLAPTPVVRDADPVSRVARPR